MARRHRRWRHGHGLVVGVLVAQSARATRRRQQLNDAPPPQTRWPSGIWNQGGAGRARPRSRSKHGASRERRAEKSFDASRHRQQIEHGSKSQAAQPRGLISATYRPPCAPGTSGGARRVHRGAEGTVPNGLSSMACCGVGKTAQSTWASGPSSVREEPLLGRGHRHRPRRVTSLACCARCENKRAQLRRKTGDGRVREHMAKWRRQPLRRNRLASWIAAKSNRHPVRNSCRIFYGRAAECSSAHPSASACSSWVRG